MYLVFRLIVAGYYCNISRASDIYLCIVGKRLQQSYTRDSPTVREKETRIIGCDV